MALAHILVSFIFSFFRGTHRSTASIDELKSHGKADSQLQHRDVSGQQQRRQQQQQEEITGDTSIAARLRFLTSISIFTARRCNKTPVMLPEFFLSACLTNLRVVPKRTQIAANNYRRRKINNLRERERESSRHQLLVY